MLSTRNNARSRALGWAATAALVAATVPTFASADEILISEITVVALAIDTAPMQREIADQSIEAALATIRQQLVEDTDSHLREKTERDVKRLLANGQSAPTS